MVHTKAPTGDSGSIGSVMPLLGHHIQGHESFPASSHNLTAGMKIPLDPMNIFDLAFLQAKQVKSLKALRRGPHIDVLRGVQQESDESLDALPPVMPPCGTKKYGMQDIIELSSSPTPMSVKRMKCAARVSPTRITGSNTFRSTNAPKTYPAEVQPLAMTSSLNTTTAPPPTIVPSTTTADARIAARNAAIQAKPLSRVPQSTRIVFAPKAGETLRYTELWKLVTSTLGAATFINQTFPQRMFRISTATTNDLGCSLTQVTPKESGICVLSIRGVNTKATMQQVERIAVRTWGTPEDLRRLLESDDYRVSHRCHNKACFNYDHLVVELKPVSRGRKICKDDGECPCPVGTPSCLGMPVACIRRSYEKTELR